MILWEAYQQGEIVNASATAGSAKQLARSAGDRAHYGIMRLEAKIDALALVSQALIEILEKRGGVTQKELEAKIKDIDLRDGRLDGKLTGGPIACQKCNRPGHTRQQVCMYCSTTLRGGTFVEKRFP